MHTFTSLHRLLNRYLQILEGRDFPKFHWPATVYEGKDQK
jgi:hypothetical protein